jgi:hypothetical protein
MTNEEFCTAVLPYGSGFDCRWEYIKTQKNGSRVFETYFHNMNECGYYDGYTKLRLTVPAVLTDFRLTLVGPKRYTDYHSREDLCDTIYHCLHDLAFAWED